MQNLVACGGGNLGVSAALNPKMMLVGWSANRRCRGGNMYVSSPQSGGTKPGLSDLFIASR